MKRLKGLSIEQHRRAAELLKIIEQSNRELVAICGEGYGWSSRITRNARKPDILRCLLDDAYAKEYPAAHLKPDLYYGLTGLP